MPRRPTPSAVQPQLRVPAVEGTSTTPRLKPFEDRVAEGVKRWAERYALSPTECDVLFQAVCGESRARLPEAMARTPGTVKKHCHNLLRKTGDDWLLEAVSRLLRELVDPEHAP
jgi:DNA-binding NarL/FixJ family response regulator